MSTEQVTRPSLVPVLPVGPPEVWRIERDGEGWIATHDPEGEHR